MACYLQSTQDAVQTWCICGLAVKAAVSLGLHAHKDLRPGSDVEKEVGTRVWCGCLILERYVSPAPCRLHSVASTHMGAARNLGVSFGRPWTIPKSFTHLCQPQPFRATDALDGNGHGRSPGYEEESLHYLNAKLSV